MGSSGDANGKEPICQYRRHKGSNPRLEKSPEGGHGDWLQYSFLENPMDRGVWQATVHRITKSRTLLKPLSTHMLTHTLYPEYLFLL